MVASVAKTNCRSTSLLAVECKEAGMVQSEPPASREATTSP